MIQLATNIADVLKLAERPNPSIQQGGENLAGVPFQARELPHSCEREVRDASARRSVSDRGESYSGGRDETSVLIRTLSQTLYALLAALTTGRSLRLIPRVPNRNGSEARRQLVVENAPETAGVALGTWVTVRQRSKKRGKHGNIRWTSRRQICMTT